MNRPYSFVRADLHWPVGERRDDQSLGAANELVLVNEVDVRDGDDAFVSFLTEVEPRLLQPLEVRRRLDVVPHLISTKPPVRSLVYMLYTTWNDNYDSLEGHSSNIKLWPQGVSWLVGGRGSESHIIYIVVLHLWSFFPGARAAKSNGQRIHGGTFISDRPSERARKQVN